MIQVISAYETSDGMIFKDRNKAEKHDRIISLHSKKQFLKELSYKQHKEKKLLRTRHWWPMDFVKLHKQKEMQREIAKRKVEIKAKFKELYS